MEKESGQKKTQGQLGHTGDVVQIAPNWCGDFVSVDDRLNMAGWKSLFVWDCVVGLGGLEPPTKRLSAASSEH
jgi:hypothetical protein